MSKSILKKIWRDLWERKGRTLICLVGLVIGLWAVTSVAVAWLVLKQDMQENFLMTDPPSIVVNLEGIAPSDFSRLEDIEGVKFIDNRSMKTGRVKVTPDQWYFFVVWVIEDFENFTVGKLFPESGKITPGLGEIIIERDGIFLVNSLRGQYRYLNQQRGLPVPEMVFFETDPDVKIKLPGGIDVSTAVVGTAHEPALAASQVESVIYGFISPETANLWFGSEIDGRLIVQLNEGYRDEKNVLEVSTKISSQLSKMGYQVGRIDFPSATEHVHQFQIDSILYLLAGMGLLALLMSVISVVNLTNSILTNQIRQIGILKAIGASTGKVMVIYLGNMVVLGLLASFIAIPMAVSSGYVISDVLSDFMNFNILTKTLPLWFSIILYLVGILFPVLAVIIPVRKWSSVSVMSAFQNFGINDLENSKINFDKIPVPLSINIRMGIRNAFRKPTRTFLTAATLGVGILCFMIAYNTRSSLLYTADLEEAAKIYDVLVSFELPTSPEDLGWINELDLVSEAETWRARRAAIIGLNDSEIGSSSVFMVPQKSDIMRPNMMEGRWLDQGLSGLVINQKIEADFPKLSVGKTITLRIGTQVITVPIVGKLKEFGPPIIYMSESEFRNFFPNESENGSLAFITLRDFTEENLGNLMRILDEEFNQKQILVSQIVSAKIASRVLRNHLEIIIYALLIVALIMLFAGTLAMASGISSSVVERSREIAILRAIGGKPKAIWTILSSESVIMAFIGWLIAFAIASPISQFVTSYFGTALVEYPIDYKGSVEGYAISLALTIFLGAFAVVAPARFANRLSIKEAIGYE